MHVGIYLSLCSFLLIAVPGCAESWINWAGNQQCHPLKIQTPLDLQELSAAIREGAAQKLTIRAVGSGYSRSELCLGEYLINTKNLNRILQVDKEKKQVRVEAGITMQALNDALQSYGLALSNQAAMSELTLGGALATGTHGGGHTGTIANFAVELELVAADGSVRRLSKESDPEAFAAAQISLGALGIIYAVTMQCEPLFYVTAEHQSMPLNAFIAQYKILNAKNDYFQCLWDVSQDQVNLDMWNRCDPEPVLQGDFEPLVCHRALCWYSMDGVNGDVASEIALPVNALPEALRITKEILFRYQQQGFDVSNIVVIRFVQQDRDILLSPAYDQDVVFVNMGYTPAGEKYAAMYKEYEKALLQLGGKPHWGKVVYLSHQEASQLYGNNLVQFIKVKNRLDPQGIFSNSFIKKLCGEMSEGDNQ